MLSAEFMSAPGCVGRESLALVWSAASALVSVRWLTKQQPHLVVNKMKRVIRGRKDDPAPIFGPRSDLRWCL